eukprot:GHVU01229799.1.p1 GENE.GHVU01229799.1~~GHVU01229799.1.p1  ORF type:complete len:384 (+),score=47.00 GHVU01229799.1:307-1458(+)
MSRQYSRPDLDKLLKGCISHELAVPGVIAAYRLNPFQENKCDVSAAMTLPLWRRPFDASNVWLKSFKRMEMEHVCKHANRNYGWNTLIDCAQMCGKDLKCACFILEVSTKVESSVQAGNCYLGIECSRESEVLQPGPFNQSWVNVSYVGVGQGHWHRHKHPDAPSAPPIPNDPRPNAPWACDGWMIGICPMSMESILTDPRKNTAFPRCMGTGSLKECYDLCSEVKCDCFMHTDDWTPGYTTLPDPPVPGAELTKSCCVPFTYHHARMQIQTAELKACGWSAAPRGYDRSMLNNRTTWASYKPVHESSPEGRSDLQGGDKVCKFINEPWCERFEDCDTTHGVKVPGKRETIVPSFLSVVGTTTTTTTTIITTTSTTTTNTTTP